MLFNSFPFLAVFLPIVLIGFFLFAKSSHELAAKWLALSSLFFCAYWSVAAGATLAVSILVNYFFAKQLVASGQSPQIRKDSFRRLLIWFAMLFNLGLLAYFKYAMFIISNVNGVMRHAGPWQIPMWNIVLPIGISFYTFTQSAFLLGCYRGKATTFSFSHYLLFVTYFPHLIAGPLLDYRQMMPQFAREEPYHFSWDRFSLALGIFTLGLAKKTILADNLGDLVDLYFNYVQAGHSFDAVASWLCVVSYAFQIYFDFSGYSDMAIGLSLFFGVTLPLNFNYPFRACNVIDFWQRWHMSLTRYILEYVYNPLTLIFVRLADGKGPVVEVTYSLLIPTMITFLIVGIWHGAGWTFIAFGILHGIYLVINHLWNMLFPPKKAQKARGDSTITTDIYQLKPGKPPEEWNFWGWALTFICLCFAYALFRADSLPTAWRVIRGMLFLNGACFYLPPAAVHLSVMGLLKFLYKLVYFESIPITTPPILALCFFLCLFVPDSVKLVDLHRRKDSQPRLYCTVSALLGFLFAFSLLFLNKPQKFIYFQF